MRLDKARAATMTVEPGERSVVARISTTDVDRSGDVVLPSGADYSDFKKNPVVMFAHDTGKLPIGKAERIERMTDGMRSKVKFADRPDSHPPAVEWLPDTVFSLFQQGVLRAFSIGFIVDEWRAATEKDMRRFGDAARRIFTKWRLIEFSVVPVPDNQNALVEAVSKGYASADSQVCDLWNIERTDESNKGGGRIIIPKRLREPALNRLRVD